MLIWVLMKVRDKERERERIEDINIGKQSRKTHCFGLIVLIGKVRYRSVAGECLFFSYLIVHTNDLHFITTAFFLLIFGQSNEIRCSMTFLFPSDVDSHRFFIHKSLLIVSLRYRFLLRPSLSVSLSLRIRFRQEMLKWRCIVTLKIGNLKHPSTIDFVAGFSTKLTFDGAS